MPLANADAAHNKSVIDKLQSSSNEGCCRVRVFTTAIKTMKLLMNDRSANSKSSGMTA